LKKEHIIQKIKLCIPDAKVFIFSEDNIHYTLIVISDSFVKETRLQQQQKVYSSLQKQIKSGEIHAISLKTYTYKKWADQQDNYSKIEKKCI